MANFFFLSRFKLLSPYSWVSHNSKIKISIQEELFSQMCYEINQKKKNTLAHCIPLHSAEFMLCNYVYLQTPNYQLSSAGAATAGEESQEVLELEERFCNEACVCEWKDKMLTKRDADTQTDILHALHIYETLRVIC